LTIHSTSSFLIGAVAAARVFGVVGSGEFSRLKSHHSKLKLERGQSVESNLNKAQAMKACTEDVALKTKV